MRNLGDRDTACCGGEFSWGVEGKGEQRTRGMDVGKLLVSHVGAPCNMARVQGGVRTSFLAAGKS